MESALIWIFALGLSAAIALPYYRRFVGKSRAHSSRREEAVALGADRPIAQYPLVDEMRCIGCGACVDACPEGEVLGIVDGRAVIINGLKCVGHGRCAEACPVEGITVGLGDLGARDDIPCQDGNRETNLPGLYIAGELGGLALIKNAVAQGEAVVEHIAATGVRASEPGMLDLLIVGAGPAGMSAALTARRAGLRYLVLEQEKAGGTILQYPRKKLVLVQPVTIPLYGQLDRQEYEKEELLAIWEEIRERFALAIRTGARLERVDRLPDGFRAHAGGESWTARHLVLALGRRGTPRKLGVPGEELGKVMYQLIDARSYRGAHVLVIGGGDSAVEAAMGLARQPGNTVTLSYRKEKLFRIKTRNEKALRPILDGGELRTLFRSQVRRIDERSVSFETPSGTVELENDFVFVFIGGEPPFALLKEIGVSFGEPASVADPAPIQSDCGA